MKKIGQKKKKKEGSEFLDRERGNKWTPPRAMGYVEWLQFECMGLNWMIMAVVSPWKFLHT